MIRLLASEWLKLRTTRSIFWTLVGAVGVVLLFVVLQLALRSHDELLIESNQLGILASADSGGFLPLVLGILLMTNEFRHRTITSTFLVTPRRELVVAAKLVVAALAGVAFAVGAFALTLAIALPWLNVRGIDVVVDGSDVAQLFASLVAGSAFFAVLGAAVGAIVRNQVAALVGLLLWFLVGEPLLVGLLPDVGRFTPTGVSTALFPRDFDTDFGADLLAPAVAAALTLVYAFGLSAIGTALVARRDVN